MISTSSRRTHAPLARARTTHAPSGSEMVERSSSPNMAPGASWVQPRAPARWAYEPPSSGTARPEELSPFRPGGGLAAARHPFALGPFTSLPSFYSRVGREVWREGGSGKRRSTGFAEQRHSVALSPACTAPPLPATPGPCALLFPRTRRYVRVPYPQLTRCH
jgi:hypothetical protein